jgi:hypothetical protein
MLLGMMEQDPKSRLEHWALIRHSAVSWIEQCLNQGNTLGRALALASELDWGGRRYSPRTLEGWLYEWRAQGFGALERQSRRDKGLSKAISPQAAEAIIKHQAAVATTLPCHQHTGSPVGAKRSIAAWHF